MFSIIHRYLLQLSSSSGLSLDKVTFVFCMFLCLPLGLVYRTLLHPSRVSPVFRRWVSLIWGLAIGYICCGSQLLNLVCVSALCYLLLWTADPRHVHKVVFIVSFTCLSVSQIWRMYQDYGTTKLDYTGRLMLMTQKLTYVAFSLHDGLGRKEEELNEGQKRERIMRVPSPLQYFSYVFHFSMLLAGPTCTFNEFTEFIEGKDIKEQNMNHMTDKQPSPTKAVLHNLGKAFFFATAFILLIPHFPMQRSGDPEFYATNPFWWRLLYSYVSIVVQRTKYYFIFILSDALHNICGLGFNGYDNKGRPLWNRACQVNVGQIEFATNFRMVNVNWNIQTSVWLRRIVYERVPHSNIAVAATYAASTVWHGFYPGYYLCAVSALLYILAERKVKRYYVQTFHRPPLNESLLTFLRWIITCIILTFCTIPVPMLLFGSTMMFFRSMFFYGHIACIAALIFVPGGYTRSRHVTTEERKNHLQNGSSKVTANKETTHTVNNHVTPIYDKKKI